MWRLGDVEGKEIVLGRAIFAVRPRGINAAVEASLRRIVAT